MRRRPSAPKPTKPVSNVNLDKVRELFAKYAAADDGSVMDMEGISNLSQALSIDPTSDVRILALMWRLGACSKPGQISLSEFEAGMQRLGVIECGTQTIPMLQRSSQLLYARSSCMHAVLPCIAPC